MSRPWRVVLWSALITLLCACATHKSPRNDTTDTLSGRLSVRIEGQPERGINAGFELTGSANEGTLVLSGPLGVSAAQARWNRGEAVLRAGDSETHFPDLQSLVEAALGEAIPLAALFDWLRGRPWSGAPMLVRTDGVAGFAQMGWQINLDRWAEGWIEARRDATPAITFRAKLEL